MVSKTIICNNCGAVVAYNIRPGENIEENIESCDGCQDVIIRVNPKKENQDGKR